MSRVLVLPNPFAGGLYRPVLAVRAMPPACVAGAMGNGARAYYYDRLWRGWSQAERALGLLLNGPPPRRQAGRAAWRLGFRPANLREVELRRDPACALDQFFDQDERKGIHAVLNHAALPLCDNPLRNKDLFAARCAAAGLPLPRPIRCAADLADMAALITKPAVGSKGRGIQRLMRAADGDWVTSDGSVTVAAAALDTWLAGQWAEGRLVQQWVAPHPSVAAISPGALPTLRIVTFRDEAGGHEVTDAAQRLSLAPDRAAENFNQDNLVASVALESGALGLALRRVEDGFVEHDTHPLTGAPIAGRVVEQMAAACALALSAHRVFADHVVIGWDIGVGEEGPVLIEGNWNPGYNVLQRAGGKGLGVLRIGALYRHHLERAGEGWMAAAPIQRLN